MLLATFSLTVLVDLTVAIEVGIVLAAIIFMHRMTETLAIEWGVTLLDPDQDDLGAPDRPAYVADRALPQGTGVFTLRGPLFFGAASRLNDAFDAAFPPPRVFILRFEQVPMIDASGVGALSRFLRRCETHGTTVFLAALEPRACAVLTRMGTFDAANVLLASTYETAVAQAAAKVGAHAAR